MVRSFPGSPACIGGYSMPPALDLARTLLFTPGNRPERFSKGMASGADGVILDLEDAVAPSQKEDARRSVTDYVAAPGREPGAPLLGLRVNRVTTLPGLKDLEALVSAGLKPDFIVLPKVESSFEVELFDRLLAGAQSEIALVCTIESAAGLERAADIARAPRVRALAFGGADLALELRAELSWEALYFARAKLVQVAAGASIGVLDVPHIVLDDEPGLRRECDRLRAMGFTGKLAIHPRQVGPIQAAFTPSEQESERAARMVDAYRLAGGDVVEFEGRMLEGPLVRAAERILALARRDEPAAERPARTS